jgi:hypothetical protein
MPALLGHARSRLAGVVLGSLAVLAALSLTASSQATSAPNDVRCAADSLRVDSLGGEASAGTDAAFLRLELRRGRPCTLSGFPGVTLLDGHRAFNVNVPRTPDFPVRTVWLATHHPAYFDLVYRAFVPATGRACRATITSLKVIPPDDEQALSVKLRRPLLRVCVSSLSVEPVGSSLLP